MDKFAGEEGKWPGWIFNPSVQLGMADKQVNQAVKGLLNKELGDVTLEAVKAFCLEA